MSLSLNKSQKKINKIEFFQCDDNNAKLISLVFERPPLYNYKLPVRERSRIYKIELWREVSDALGVSVDECRSRWKNLRDTYQLYRHKNRNTFAKWKFSEDLCFLENLHTYRTRKRNIKLEHKVLVSVPEISESPLHEINIQNTHEEIVEEEEVIHEDDEEHESYILEDIRNSDISDSLISNSIHIKEYNPLDEYKNTEILDCETGNFIETVEINCKKIPTTQKLNNRTPKRNFKCIEKESNERITNELSNMDELDVFMEFLKKKMRKFSPNDISDVQMKFIEIIFQKDRDNQNQKYK